MGVLNWEGNHKLRQRMVRDWIDHDRRIMATPDDKLNPKDLQWKRQQVVFAKQWDDIFNAK